MYVTQHVAVTLSNGRSHVLRLPEGVDARAAAEALCGFRSGAEAGWPAAEGEWLQIDQGDGWVHRSAIAEVSLVDWADQPQEIY